MVKSTINMNAVHRYLFDKGSKKHLCPECSKKRFVRYMDTETNSYLPDQYGRCDRESKCSYHLNPYKSGYSKRIWEQEQGRSTVNCKPYKPTFIKKQYITPKPLFIPVEVLKQTLNNYEENQFIQNLLQNVPFPFSVTDIEKTISLYRLGTISNGYRTGANTFPFIDLNNNIRAIQVKQFDNENHTTGTDFLHSIIDKHHTRNNKPLPKWLEAYQTNEIKVSCLFGEQLLSKYPYNPVALVEAPKTAVYGSLYFGTPEKATNLIWLAVYNLSSLNLNKCKALKGRNVYLFPDLSKDGKAFELWSNKAEQIAKHLKGTSFKVSDILEQLAPQQDKDKGKDLADYLIQQDWRLFRKHDLKEEPKPVKTSISEKGVKRAAPKTTLFLSLKDNQPIKEQPENWEQSISELETYFTGIVLPTKPFKLNQCCTITNTALFIESHFATVKRNKGNKVFLPYLNRLHKLKQQLSTN